jgi:hypothetical protein
MTQETSKAVYFAEILPTLSDRHQKVLKYLATVENATNMEISEALKWSINRVTGRTNELVKRGLVEFALERQCKITSRKVNAWRVVSSKPAPAKDPGNYRCSHPGCPKTAVTYLNEKPVCQRHSVSEIAPAGLGL